MTNAITLRAPNEDEKSSLADLWVASWREAMPQIDFEARRPWFCAHLIDLEASGAVIVCAFDAAGPLGFMTVDPKTGHIDQIALAPRAKGGPAGKLLLGQARRLSPGGLRLEVNQDNPRAVRFYEREGFERVGESVNPRSGLRTWRLKWSPE